MLLALKLCCISVWDDSDKDKNAKFSCLPLILKGLRLAAGRENNSISSIFEC